MGTYNPRKDGDLRGRTVDLETLRDYGMRQQGVGWNGSLTPIPIPAATELLILPGVVGAGNGDWLSIINKPKGPVLDVSISALGLIQFAFYIRFRDQGSNAATWTLHGYFGSNVSDLNEILFVPPFPYGEPASNFDKVIEVNDEQITKVNPGVFPSPLPNCQLAFGISHDAASSRNIVVEFFWLRWIQAAPLITF